MTQCQACAGRATLFLCGSCQGKLESLLVGLGDYTVLTNNRTGETAVGAPWLESLADAAHGNTRLGVSVRRSTDYSGPLPFNEKASELLDEATSILYRWVTAVNLNNEQLGMED